MKESLDNLSLSEQLKQRYEKIFLIISPPRCSSTALARVFWHHPSIRYYSHEPYETVYYNADSTKVAHNNLFEPIDLATSYSGKSRVEGQGLVIKEMPYQVGSHFQELASFATNPLVFLIRDPRLSIKSRIDKRIEAEQEVNFPLIETGWELIAKQIEVCEQSQQKFYIVDSTEMRNFPAVILSELFYKIGLSFDYSMLNWEPAEQVNLDNLDGKHSHLYQRVLRSSSIEKASEKIPTLDEFPNTNGFREHVRQAMGIYNELRKKPQMIKEPSDIKNSRFTI